MYLIFLIYVLIIKIIDINLLSGVLNEIYVRNEAKRRRQQRTESLTQGQEVERLPPRYEPNRSYLEHSEHSKSEQEPKEATSSKEKRSNRLSGSTASNEQTIKEAEETVNDLKENDDAFEKPKSLATSSPKNQYQVPKQVNTCNISFHLTRPVTYKISFI